MFLGKKTFLIGMIGMVIAFVEALHCGEGQKEYTVGLEKRPWNRALADCSKDGGTLAAVDGSSMQRIYAEITTTDASLVLESFWLGGACDDECTEESNWYWISTSTPVHGNWDYYPHRTEYCGCAEAERYLITQAQQLQARKSSELHLYICEHCNATKPTTPEPVTPKPHHKLR